MLQINNDQLKQFYEKCQKDKLIAIDTEFYRVDTYFPELCLIQLSNSSECIFLDPISHKLDLSYLKKILFNTKIKKFFMQHDKISKSFLICLKKSQDLLLIHKYVLLL